jgi:hypothetical protein
MYPAAITITGGRAANLDLCVILMPFTSGSSFTHHTCCDTRPRFKHGLIRRTCTHVLQLDSNPQRRISRSLRRHSNHCIIEGILILTRCRVSVVYIVIITFMSISSTLLTLMTRYRVYIPGGASSYTFGYRRTAEIFKTPPIHIFNIFENHTYSYIFPLKILTQSYIS